MRMRVICGLGCLCLMALLVGCGKSGQSEKQPPMEIEGVKVDTPQMMAEFLDTSPDLYRQANDVMTKVRYKQYVEAMVDLDDLLKKPGLNEKQKKVVTQVLDQLKEVVGKTAPGQKQ